MSRCLADREVIGLKRLRYQNGSLDATDAALLKALAANARLPTAELARLVGLSPPSTAERVKRLEETGVINGYHAAIDPLALGLQLAVHIRIKPMLGQLAKLTQLLTELPEIVECHRITGDDCFIATAHVASVARMEMLIDKILPLGTTNTALIQSSPVPTRMPSLSV
jgi:Lrp/AsnC family transcriptional regulator, leucine-responsive regulatory protein